MSLSEGKTVVLGGNCTGEIVQGAIVLGTNCPGSNCPRWQLSGGQFSKVQSGGGGGGGGGNCLELFVHVEIVLETYMLRVLTIVKF